MNFPMDQYLNGKSLWMPSVISATDQEPTCTVTNVERLDTAKKIVRKKTSCSLAFFL